MIETLEGRKIDGREMGLTDDLAIFEETYGLMEELLVLLLLSLMSKLILVLLLPTLGMFLIKLTFSFALLPLLLLTF